MVFKLSSKLSLKYFLFFSGSRYDKLNQMMDDLDNHYEPKVVEFEKAMKEKKPLGTPHTFSVGDLVAAVWHHDQMWYRGVVKAVKEEKYEVFLFDYGDTVWVRDPYIWPLDSKFCILPKQAIRAKLSGITVSAVNASMTSVMFALQVSCLPEAMTRQGAHPGPERPLRGCCS